MAGDWIKMRCDLRSDPAVFKLAGITGLDRFSVVGRLAEFWSWIDKHAVDGRVDGGTSTAIDDVVDHVGFADALVAVRWLVVDADGVYIPKHEQHNGDSAKERNLKSERQARWREKQAAKKASIRVDGNVDATPSTREEKRREEKKTPIVPKGTQLDVDAALSTKSQKPAQVEIPDWIPAKPWEDFVAMRRAKGQKAPFTVAAAKGIVSKLAGLKSAGHDVAESLNQSVINGWSDVFEPRGSGIGRIRGATQPDWTGAAT